PYTTLFRSQLGTVERVELKIKSHLFKIPSGPAARDQPTGAVCLNPQPTVLFRELLRSRLVIDWAKSHILSGYRLGGHDIRYRRSPAGPVPCLSTVASSRRISRTSSTTPAVRAGSTPH